MYLGFSMLPKINPNNILYLDIETVPEVYDYDSLDPQVQDLWTKKTRFIQEREQVSSAEVYDRAGIYAEFGKVVCISTAFRYEKEGVGKLRVKSFYGDDEKKVLQDFAKMLDTHFKEENKFLCGHNLKEFDVPFMARRMLVHGISLPEKLNIAGKKPWQVSFLDTMELWKFGDYKHFTSLNLLAHLFGIPTPKDDISGADVGRVYWEEKDLERIRIYCEKDTITVAHVMHKFKNIPLVADEQIETV